MRDQHPAAAATNPGGAMVLVTSQSPAGRRYLILRRHQADAHVSQDGHWAWGPPSGCLEPGEDIGTCAARELYEETGITGEPEAVATHGVRWAVFRLEVPWGVEVRLHEGEHDRYAWVTFDEACLRCRPKTVADNIRLAAGRGS